MELLVISDGHGDLEKLKSLSPIAEKVDGIIYGGDFAAFQKPETGKPFLEELLKLHKNIFAVLGNCDHPEFIKELEAKNISCANKCLCFNDFFISGSGGGSKFTGATPYERTEKELVSDFCIVEKKVNETGVPLKNLILVCHNPPYGAKTDKINPLIHVGSKLITAFIKKHKPVLVVSGHIHEAYAIDKIGDTLLLNPGALMEGRYAIVKINNLPEDKTEVTAELKSIY